MYKAILSKDLKLLFYVTKTRLKDRLIGQQKTNPYKKEK